MNAAKHSDGNEGLNVTLSHKASVDELIGSSNPHFIIIPLCNVTYPSILTIIRIYAIIEYAYR